MKLDLSTTAVVITDPQVDVLSAEGALADLLHAEVARLDVVSNLRRLRDAAESVHVPVVYSTLQHTEKNGEAHPSKAPIYALMRERGAMHADRGGAIHPELAPTDRTVVAWPRAGMAAFGTTDLDTILRTRGVRTLVMGGMVLNLCLEANVRSAVDLGYEVIVVDDATATVSEEARAATLGSLALIASQIVSTEEVVAALVRSKAA